MPHRAPKSPRPRSTPRRLGKALGPKPPFDADRRSASRLHPQLRNPVQGAGFLQIPSHAPLGQPTAVGHGRQAHRPAQCWRQWCHGTEGHPGSRLPSGHARQPHSPRAGLGHRCTQGPDRAWRTCSVDGRRWFCPLLKPQPRPPPPLVSASGPSQRAPVHFGWDNCTPRL